MKGLAAYVDHARVLGQESEEIYLEIHRLLSYYSTEDHHLDSLLETALAVGALNLKVMELLDKANTGTYGHPVPTKVRTTGLKGKAILVSGHDSRDLAMLLEQTKEMDIKIYTHGEMLPCHGYPELKKYPNLVGNYGGAWQDQQKEFAEFPGAILMTTNCIQKPQVSYEEHIFTTGLVTLPGVVHIGENENDNDFAQVIEAAMNLPRFLQG